ncbi:type II TA system antitoxin MqsA family protein [Desulfatibacillum aliphaticivorans]|uniref:type II TA system antitoxin MqsA family protein n=1 Tax=Desulfatibacillum aliphaticivorans TaxID=218208 RepID=UPI000684C73B|nr:type II TA system antitoxin MqsA family protein [Desulfatibacillum aliphaticivorans]
MKCPQCKSEMAAITGRHRYKGSGLDHVFLTDVEVFECSCGERLMALPRVKDLNALLGRKLIMQPSLLGGEEIRFLRKNMRLKAKDFADKIGVQQSTVSRWEKGKQQPDIHVDFVIRALCAAHYGLGAKELIDVIWPEALKNAGKEKPKIELSKADWMEPVLEAPQKPASISENDIEIIAARVSQLVADRMKNDFHETRDDL